MDLLREPAKDHSEKGHAMALDQSALLDLLEALKAAEVDDRIRTASEAHQALIEAELTVTIGAGPHERTENRTAQRNGSRPRTLTTTAGDLELRIPKLRAGSFFPSLLERRRPDHRGELGLDQRLVERLGGGADAVVNVGGLQCLKQLEQGRLIQGHRVAFL